MHSYCSVILCPQQFWGTGIIGLTRGLETLHQFKQKPLMVKDKIERPPGQLGVSKSVECDISLSVLLTLLVGQQEGNVCWFIGGDNLAGALHIL